MEIKEQRHGAVTVLKAEGALVGEDAERFKAAAADAIRRSLGRFVVDASAIPFVDSRGLEVLFEATEELSQSGQSLRLCGAGETLREVLDVTDLAQHFEHYSDVTSAVRSFL